ncbi:DUF3311 domain-containing protein [Spongisporangium articulatum]|uniref:DUF3311 domain-containing protein n=1 Tax=Spongisporangium articulatum TaxID=3362603 RepID=A0ABW8AI94_9ACTN
MSLNDETRARDVRPDHSEHSPWNYLLAIPIVLPLLTPLFNRKEPIFLGFPAFYWLQLAFVLVGVATTVTVYRMTKRGD